MLRKIILILSIACLWPSTAMATAQIDGVDVFLTGQDFGWTAGADPTLQIRDTQINGDVTADDGLYSLDINQSGNGGDGIAARIWKAESVGGSIINVPRNGASAMYRPNQSSTIKFVMDTRTFGDGFIPDPSGVPGSNRNRAFLYTVPSVHLTSETLRVTGDFQSEMGGTDWDANESSAVIMSDDGATRGDAVAGNLVYTTQLTGIAAGTYSFKVTANGSFDVSAGKNGWGGDNNTFLVVGPSDVLTVEFQTALGRTKVTNSNPAASPGPPWYGTSSAWELGLNASTALFDDGTNGDVISGDGIYSRAFTSTVTSSPSGTLTQTTVLIKQGSGGFEAPGGNGYPISVTTGQAVLVQFDTNASGDGFSPAKNYMWTDPASRRPVDYVQVVGSFQSDFLIGASDFDNNSSSSQLFDDGTTGGDVNSGDGIYANTFSNILGITDSRFWKGIGLKGSWSYQYGGEIEGASFSGDNSNILFAPQPSQSFTIDAVTGRINVGLGLPSRPSTINSNPPSGPSVETSVDEWMLYE